MTKQRKSISVLVLILVFGVFTVTCKAEKDNTELLKLAEGGKTNYSIVIGAKATKAEEYAAKELAYFLKKMTGAKFPVKRDSVPVSKFEIVLGNTDRYKLKDVPAELKPKVPEGFVILHQGSKLYILGNIPRATLYGVYDFLEQELGVRFLVAAINERDPVTKKYVELIPAVNYIPQNNALSCEVNSRKYDPLMEYRNIYSDSIWAVRNRLNASWGMPPMRVMLGGCEYLTFVHNLPKLLPHKKYFDKHPEYYALRNGKRQRKNDTLSFPSHPCLTNPDVLSIVIENVRKTIENYKKHTGMYNPYSQIIMPIEYTDHDEVCQCNKCQAVNKEEGTKGGTIFRFLNAVAEAIEKDYPNVLLETIAYHATETPPKKTRFRKNVIIRFAPTRSDFARSLDDPKSTKSDINSSFKNYNGYQNLLGWSKMTDKFHVWYYTSNLSKYMIPHPDLRGIAMNFPLLYKNGMRGMFAQSSMSVGGGNSINKLRQYLIAKLMWRPETNARKTIEEFCHLYYGKADKTFLKYIDSIHDYHYSKVDPDGKNPLTVFGAPRHGHSYDDDFIDSLDTLLNQAEAEAETPEKKFRVAEERLAPWYMMLTKEFKRKGQSFALPEKWYFKPDPRGVGLKQGWQNQTAFKKWTSVKSGKFRTKQNIVWYAVKFKVTEEAAGDSLSLFFNNMNGACDIFLDGSKVGKRKNPADGSFYIPIKKFVKAGRHTLMIRVEKKNSTGSVWMPVTLVDSSQKPSKRLRTAGKRWQTVSKKAGVECISEEYGPRKVVKQFRIKVDVLLKRKPYRPGNPTPGVIHFDAAKLTNVHKTYSIIKDDTAISGFCVKQKVKHWTQGQAIGWAFNKLMKDSVEKGTKYKIRVRIKVDKIGDNGKAFRLLYAHYYDPKSWRSKVCGQIDFPAADVPNGKWKWYYFPSPEYKKTGREQVAYVWTPNNPKNISAVYVDSFELIPEN